MLDHVFLSVSDLDRSIEFYERALAPLGIRHTVDFDGANGPEGHPDLKGFGRDGRMFFWLRRGSADATVFMSVLPPRARRRWMRSTPQGATDNGAPGIRPYYDPRYYAANVLDPDGYSIEVVYKSWQHPQP